jgi:hypothetical protein
MPALKRESRKAKKDACRQKLRWRETMFDGNAGNGWLPLRALRTG